MIKHLTFDDFLQAFKDYDREDQFSYEAKLALWDELKEYEDSTDEQIELDVIALCTEYTEYENLDQALDQYDNIDSFDQLRDYTYAELLANDAVLVREF